MKRSSKRISLFAVVMLAILPGLTKASTYHYATQYRVRWSPYTHGLIYGDLKYSPYAKQRGNSGLVYRRLRYSPYAKKFGNSGLVYDNMRYSPYAFGFKSSGLIADPWGESYDYHCLQTYQNTRPCVVVHHSTSQSSRTSTGRSTPVYSVGNNNSWARLAARQAKAEQLKRRREKIRTTDEFGGKDIISAYLRLKNIDFRINRILSIENNLISVDFILTDKNTIIKYWNPEKILALQKENDPRISSYENYLKSYKDFVGRYLDSGGRIYQIITADDTEILSKLLEFQKQCDEQELCEPCETTNVAKANGDSTALALAD
ncbi:MAG: hypothetical protein AMJ75_07940 [Phycisphaerae bacterium SM1_79]|nr:MAG: hypothetical protein AMJ75_07940 [Phycisphaerae bacterium SM1_79]